MKKYLILLLTISLLICCFVPVFAEGSNPLFQFDYNGLNIKTYGTYSTINGKMCDSHRIYIKDGNMVLIDHELNAKPNDIFIHYSEGKSYIAVITESGHMLSLGTEDLLNLLDSFDNKEIVSLAENITYDSTLMIFKYKNGSSITYDCITGKIIESNLIKNKDPLDYFSNYMSSFFSRSTKGFIDNSGKRAQSLILTLENSGSNINALFDSGIVDGIENYEGKGIVDYSNLLFTDDYNFEEDEAYLEFINNNPNLADEQIYELRENLIEISKGKITAVSASSLMSFSSPEVDSLFLEIEKNRTGKKFINREENDKYIAIYNAKESRYEIYKESDILNDPSNFESIISSETDVDKVNKLNALLTKSNKLTDNKGVILFFGILVVIIALAVIIFIISKKNEEADKKNRKLN